MKLSAGSSLVLVLASVLITGAVMPAFAVQLDTLLIPQRGQADAFFKNVEVVYIEYPNGGKLQSIFEGINDSIQFTADKDTPGVQVLIDKINANLINEKNSPVKVQDAKIEFRGTLKADSKRAALEHNVKIDLVITDFVLGGSGVEGRLLDLNWRGFYVDEPVLITTEQYGPVDINFPSGYLYAKHPEVMAELENTEAMKILNSPSIDLRELTNTSIDKWAWLFDPTGSIKESERFGFKEVEGANVITFFAYGESNLETGTIRERVSETNFAIDGTQYAIRKTTPPSSSSIQIAGYAEESIHGTDEGAIVFDQVPEGAGKSYTGGMPLVVLGALGGIMGAVAGFVLWRARK